MPEDAPVRNILSIDYFTPRAGGNPQNTADSNKNAGQGLRS
jgi:hypothetical protein